MMVLLFPTAMAELLLRDDPLFLHFMAVALLSVEAKELERMMQESTEQAVDRLCHLRVVDESQVSTLAALASSLDQETPRSFRPAPRSRLHFPLNTRVTHGWKHKGGRCTD